MTIVDTRRALRHRALIGVVMITAAAGCRGSFAKQDAPRSSPTPASSVGVPASPSRPGDMSGALAIIGGTVYASPEAPPLRDAVVLIKEGKVAAVGRRNVVDCTGAQTIDASGGTITAGFQNSHVHFTEPKWQDAAHLSKAAATGAIEAMLTRYGFTTVVDTGSLLANTLALRGRIEAGEIPGPRILTAGTPLYPPHGVPYYLRGSLPPEVLTLLPQPSSAEEATRIAAVNLAAGADVIKLFTGSWTEHGKVVPMPTDVASAAAAEAHRAGKLVFAHPSNVSGLEVAIAAHVDVLAHAVEDTSGLSDALLERMRAANTVLIPTLHLFRDDSNLEAIFKEVRDYGQAHGRIVFGTDVGYLPDYDPTDEYQLLQRAGLDSREILAALTTAPAEIFGEGGSRGRLVRGMAADVVVLDGDPMSDVRNFARVRATLRKGVIIYARQ